MKRTTWMLAALALLFGVGQAKAGPMYSFNYSDGTNTASGTVTTVDSGLGDGSLLATSGTLTVTSGAATGVYSLIPEGPAVSLSPSGAFLVDDLIYPNNNAASGVNPAIGSNPSFLTNWGLLFGGAGLEINIFGNGGGDYAFLAFSTNTGGFPVFQGSGGAFSLTATPEPTTLAVFGALAVGAFGVRRRMKVAKTA